MRRSLRAHIVGSDERPSGLQAVVVSDDPVPVGRA
jgi:hypothetical protein